MHRTTTDRVPSPSGTGQCAASAADLCVLICAARPEIVEAGAGTAQRMELSHQLRKMLAALEQEEPDLAPVRDRWKRVLRQLGPAAGTSRIAQVTDMLIVLCRVA